MYYEVYFNGEYTIKYLCFNFLITHILLFFKPKLKHIGFLKSLPPPPPGKFSDRKLWGGGGGVLHDPHPAVN